MTLTGQGKGNVVGEYEACNRDGIPQIALRTGTAGPQNGVYHYVGILFWVQVEYSTYVNRCSNTIKGNRKRIKHIL